MLFDVQAQQLPFAVDFMVAQHMLVAHLHTRHHLPGTEADRCKGCVEVGHRALAGLVDAVDVQGQFAALFLEARQVDVADPHTEARLEGHAVHRHTVTERQGRAGEVAMAVAPGRAQTAAEFALALVIEIAGAGIGIHKQAALQAVRREACADAEEGQVGIGLATCATDIAAAVAETGMGAELFGKALGQANHHALAMLVAAGGLGRTVGAQIPRQGGAPQAILPGLEVDAAGERRGGLLDHRALAQQVARSVGMHLTADGGLHAPEAAGIDGRLQVVVVGAVGARQVAVLQLLQQLRAGRGVAGQVRCARQAVVEHHLAAQHVDGFLGQAEALLEVVIHRAVLRGHLVQAGLQVTGLHTDQRPIDGRQARWQRRQGRLDARGGVVVGRQVVAHDGGIVDPGDALQHSGGPARAVLAGGAVEQRSAIDRGQLIEQLVELAAHPWVADEITVGVLHHGGGFGGAVERDVGDVRARRGAADDVDVGVRRTRGHRVGRGGDLAGRAQVVDRLDAQAVEGRQIRRRRRQRVGAVKHPATHRAVIGRGIRGGETGDIAQVIDALQAWGVEGDSLGRLGGSDGQAQNRQRTHKSLEHSAASLKSRWAD
ncbi:hypothetical protein D3C84_545720 [compost metagenome]